MSKANRIEGPVDQDAKIKGWAQGYSSAIFRQMGDVSGESGSQGQCCTRPVALHSVSLGLLPGLALRGSYCWNASGILSSCCFESWLHCWLIVRLHTCSHALSSSLTAVFVLLQGQKKTIF